MRLKGDDGVGKFAVDFEVANHADVMDARRGLLAEEKVRRTTISGVVDSGATRLVLPTSIAKQLGLAPTGKVKVTYAGRQTATRDFVEDVDVTLLGRHGVFTAALEPKRTTALIGAIVLEDLDFLVDCTKQKLVPRDPDYVVSELE